MQPTYPYICISPKFFFEGNPNSLFNKVQITDSIWWSNEPNMPSQQQINRASSQGVSVDIGLPTFMNKLHSGKIPSARLNLQHHGSISAKPIALDNPHCISAVACHSEGLQVKVACESEALTVRYASTTSALVSTFRIKAGAPGNCQLHLEPL